MNIIYSIIFSLFLCQIPCNLAKSNVQKNVIEDIVEIKEFKKLLRTKTNVLICYTSSTKQSSQIIKVFKEAAVSIKGQGTMVLVDCSSEARKLCKKLKVNPEPYILKHYKDGEFNKDYDRRDTVASIVNFMRDPTGDIPWEEDSNASDVVHIADAVAMVKLIKKEPKPILIMFYAPWCGFCKTLKPEYAGAASELKNQYILAAIDVNRPENAVIRTQFNITGFPTLLYFEHGVMKMQYEGENNKNGLISFMKNPYQPPVKLKEPDWSDTDSEVVHLTSDSFEPVLKDEASALVMFYAPWCGHCKRMKPEYEKAAAEMKNRNIPGMLGALDATKEPSIAAQFNVKGYPTVKYFAYGELKFDVNLRDSLKIVEFMKNPKEPPPPPPPEKPWSEETSEVVHLNDENFKPFLKKKKHVLVMFYAPWCGHCKKAKPEFTSAANTFKDDPKVMFAAVDCTQHATICSAHEVKGYPTIKYFNYYKTIKPYNGGRLEADFIKFMSDPENPNAGAAPPAPVDGGYFTDAKDVEHLTDSNFQDMLKASQKMFVMFYAPWCGHCKKMIPEIILLAADMKNGVKIGELDCTVNTETAETYKISGFPTIKLFENGKFVADYKGKRTVEEMKNFINNPTPKDEL